MQPQELATLLDVSSNTIRRWCREFHGYLTPAAHPQKGKVRALAPHDVRVLRLVAQARAAGQPHETIRATLDTLRDDGWRELPEIPPEWAQNDETISVPAAAARAYDMAQIAVLQRDLDQVRGELELARARVGELETALASAEAAGQDRDTRYHALELELAQERGRVAELQARLSGFSLAGGRSLSPAALMLIALAAGAALMLIAFVVLRLAG